MMIKCKINLSPDVPTWVVFKQSLGWTFPTCTVDSILFPTWFNMVLFYFQHEQVILFYLNCGKKCEECEIKISSTCRGGCSQKTLTSLKKFNYFFGESADIY